MSKPRSGKKSFSGNRSSSGGSHFQPKPAATVLLISPSQQWYDTASLPPLPQSLSGDAQPLSDSEKSELLKKATELLLTENIAYQSDSTRSSSQKQFFSEIITSGTLSDRISALTLLIQESPLHAVKTLESLLGLAKKKSRTAALQAVASLKDMFISGGVLPDRRLKWFASQELLTSRTPKQWLIVWAFEDWLKSFYFQFVQLLETLAHDAVVHVRLSVLQDIMDLLKAKPEQEVNLLRLGVNKLGDLDKKTASRASHLLLELEQVHPAMKPIIFDAISELVFKANSDYHAKYYSMITLNQTIITSKETEVATSLLQIYFTLFERLLANTKTDKDQKLQEKKVKKKPRWKSTRNPTQTLPKKLETTEEIKEEENMKLVSAILTGVNRAFPYSTIDDSMFNKHLSTLYWVARTGNFNTSIQALILLSQISNSKDVLSDRFFRALYESLLDPRVITSSKQALYLNLVFKALKQDLNVKRAKAFVKRLIQLATETMNIGFAAGVVFLISELEESMPSIRELISENEDDDSSDVEVFHDARESSPEEANNEEAGSSIAAATARSASSGKSSAYFYDGKASDPLKSNAEYSCLWEILPLLNHYHPTVAYFARNLYDKQKNKSRPDLALHTLSHFLDRFIYKSPKTKISSRGGSIMQPIVGSGAFETKDVLLLSTRGAKASRQSVNNVDWNAQAKNQEGIIAEDKFFYDYFISKGGAGQKKSLKAKVGSDEDEMDDNSGEESDELEIDDAINEGDSDAGEHGSSGDDDDDDVDDDQEDLAEDEVWDAMVKSRPEIENIESEQDDDDDDDEQLDKLMGDDVDSEDIEDAEDEDEENYEGIDKVLNVDSDIEGSLSSEAPDFDEEDDLLDSDDEVAIDNFDSDEELDSDEADLMAEFEREIETNQHEVSSKISIKNAKRSSTKAEKEAETKPNKKRKTERMSTEKAKKIKLKELPVFASIDDYKDLLSDDD